MHTPSACGGVVDFPATPDPTAIEQALANLECQLKDRPIEDLIDLPLLTDPEATAAMQLLGQLFSAIFLGAPGLLPILSCSMVSLSLQFGNAPTAAMGYAVHGVTLCNFGDVEAGYRFGRLAIDLLEQFKLPQPKAIILALFGAFIQHRKESLRATIPTLKGGYTAGVEIGNFLHAGYSIVTYFVVTFLSGIELGAALLERRNQARIRISGLRNLSI